MWSYAVATALQLGRRRSEGLRRHGTNNTDQGANWSQRCAWCCAEVSSSEHPAHRYAMSTLGQLHAVAMAFRMLLRYEQRFRVAFDWVARVRPDGLWWQSTRAALLPQGRHRLRAGRPFLDCATTQGGGRL